MNRSISRPTLLLAFLATLPLAAQAPQNQITVDRIFSSGDFFPEGPPDAHFLSGGRSFIEARPTPGGVEIVRTDIATGASTVLVPAGKVVGDNGQRLDVQDISVAATENEILVYHNSERVWRLNTRGLYHVLDLRTGRTTPISRANGLQMFAKISPDGKRVAFVRDNNIYVSDIAGGAERPLTRDGSETIVNGTSDWVYEEEMDLRDAFRWSPDSKKIAFWRFDQSPIPLFPLVDESGLYPQIRMFHYPKAGAPNSLVTLGVVDVASGDTRWIDTGSNTDIYLPRMEWADNDSVTVQRLPRKQNKVEFLMASVVTGKSRLILADSDAAYVDVSDPVWLADGKRFLWLSDRNGYRQAYLYNRSGALERRLASGDADALSIEGVDEARGDAYLQVAAPDPTQRQIFRCTLGTGACVQVTQTHGSWSLSVAPGSSYGILSHSSMNDVPTSDVVELPSLRVVRSIASNDVVRGRVAALGLKPTEFLRIPAADAKSMLYAYRILPPDFDPSKRYPVLLYVYGAPASLTVEDSWGGSRTLWHEMLAQKGYIVMSVDSRGNGWRGRDWRKITQGNVGIIESDDQIAAAKWIASQSWADPARIGIWGWSGGGYMTAMSLTRGGSVYKMGISVAPVTDWRLYDTIYTERYMGTPQENPGGYDRTSAQAYVRGLTATYLMVHGTGDDNVHLQNTIQMARQLELARKPFLMKLFPGKTHAISGSGGTLPLFDALTRFILENL